MNHAPPSHLENFVTYVGTREGVEKIDNTTALLPQTAKQKDLIQDILKKYLTQIGCMNIMITSKD